MTAQRRHRRLLLQAAAAALIATASPWVMSGEVQVEGAAYGGSTTGQWVCGPIGRARYAGAAGAIRASERSMYDDNGLGWNARVAAAAEHERVTIVHREPCHPCRPGPPARVMGGGSGRIGYGGSGFGVQTGLALFQGWESSRARSPALAMVPELELTFGKPTGGRGFVGFGTSWLTTQRRPALYGGGVVRLDPTYELAFGTGAYRAGPALAEATALRLDAQLRARLDEAWEIRIGSSLSLDVDYGEEPGFENSLSLVTEL